MAIFEGKKFEPALGNMRVASHAEAEKLQIILDLKAKRKLIQDEITRLCKELPSNVALVAKTTHNEEVRHSSFVVGPPRWLHYAIPEISIERHNTTIADKKSLNLND